MKPAKRGQEFADLAHRILVNEDRFSLKAVAARAGLGYDALYARLRNETMFSPEEIRSLLAAAPDPRFVTFLLLGTPFVAADRANPGEAPTTTEASLRASVLHMLIEAGDVAEVIEKAIDDGRMEAREAAAIIAEIDVAERALATLRQRIIEMTGKTFQAQTDRPVSARPGYSRS